MTEDQKPQELTLQQHAEQELATVEAGIAALREKWGGVVFDVETTAGMDQAKKARLEIRAPRYEAQRIVKAKKSELAQISRDLGARGEQIIEQIMEIEGPIHAQIEAVEARKAAEKAERERQEAEARQKQVQRVLALRGIPQTMIGATVEELDAATVALMDDDLADVDEVYKPDAVQAREKSIEDLQVMRTQRAEQDAKDAELAKLREEAAERDRQDAERRQAEEAERTQREEAERQAQAERDAAHQAELEAERAKQAELQRQLDEQAAEARRREEAEAAERARIAQEAEAAELARQQAEELERAQAALAAQEQAIREASALEAMTEARNFLIAEGYANAVPTLKLTSVMARMAVTGP